MTAVICYCVFNLFWAESCQVYAFSGISLLTFFIQRLQTFFILVTFFKVFNVFYFFLNVFYIYASKLTRRQPSLTHSVKVKTDMPEKKTKNLIVYVLFYFKLV